MHGWRVLHKHTLIENAKEMRKEQTKRCRKLIFGDRDQERKKSLKKLRGMLGGSGETGTLNNANDRIQLIKEMRTKQRERKKSTINIQQLD